MMFGSPLFPLGEIVATIRALSVIEESGERPEFFILRHARGDWGTIDSDDRMINERSLYGGDRIFSSYRFSSGAELWIITEWDRARTILLLPDEI